jgi:hypothetical protein
MNAKNSKMNHIMSLLGSQEANIGKIRSELSDIQKEISVNENKLKFIQNFEQFLNMEESEAIVTLEKEDFLKVNGTFKYLLDMPVRESSFKSFEALKTIILEQKEKISKEELKLKESERKYEELEAESNALPWEVNELKMWKKKELNDLCFEIHSFEFGVGDFWPEKIWKLQQKIKLIESKLIFIDNLEQISNMEEDEAIATLEHEKLLKVDGTFNYLFKLSMMECTSKAFKALETTLSEHEKEMVNLKQQELKDIEKLKKMNEEYEMKLSVENSVQDFSSKSIDCLKAEIKHTEDAEILKKLEEELRMKETIKKTMKKKGKKASRKR